MREACALVGGAVVGGAVGGGAVGGAVVAVVPDGARAELPSETDVGGAAEEAGGVAVWEEEAGVLGLVGDVVGREADVEGCEEVVFADVDVADAGVLLLAGMDSVDADAEGVLMAVESVWRVLDWLVGVPAGGDGVLDAAPLGDELARTADCAPP